MIVKNLNQLFVRPAFSPGVAFSLPIQTFAGKEFGQYGVKIAEIDSLEESLPLDMDVFKDKFKKWYSSGNFAIESPESVFGLDFEHRFKQSEICVVCVCDGKVFRAYFCETQYSLEDALYASLYQGSGPIVDMVDNTLYTDITFPQSSGTEYQKKSYFDKLIEAVPNAKYNKKNGSIYIRT